MKKIVIHRIRCNALGSGRQPHPANQLFDAEKIRCTEQPHRNADIRCPDHTNRNCFAVAIARVARLLLDGVCNRMTEVQDAAQPPLALVLPHDIRLDLTGARNHMRRRGGFESKDIRAVLLKPRKEVRVTDDAVLDDLTEPRCNLPRGQRPQQIQIHKDGIGLIERADEVLAERMVDGDLAADTGIYLREEARRHLNERNAAHIARRNEARKVADHAAAKCNDRRLPIEAQLDCTRKKFVRLCETLRRLARRNRDDLRVHTRTCNNACDSIGAERSNIRIRDDHAVCGVPCPRHERNDFVGDAAADHDRIAACPEFDHYLTHIIFSKSASPVRCTPPPRAGRARSYRP